MPSTITHAYFSMDLYDRFDVKKRETLKPYKEQLKIFAQGPDVFFFYNLLSHKKGKHIRDLGLYMQQNETQTFFVNLINTIKKKKLERNPEIRAFLYGFISHYILDMTMHPFILFRTGYFDKKTKESYKYRGGHERMETYIDAYFIRVRANIRPKNFKTTNFCFKRTDISAALEDTIDDVLSETFNITAGGSQYVSSIKQMKAFYKFFRYDRTGIKKMLYSFGKIFPLKEKTSSISYHIKLNQNEYYLNLDKDRWHHPLDVTEIYNYSFIELYSIALSRALTLIEEVDRYLYNRKNAKPLEVLFPNLSYVTGKECKLGIGEHFSY